MLCVERELVKDGKYVSVEWQQYATQQVAVRSISRHAQPIILNPTREHPFARVNTVGVERAKQMCVRQELLASAHDLVCGPQRV